MAYSWDTRVKELAPTRLPAGVTLQSCSKVAAKRAVRCIIFNPANALPFCALFKRTFRWKLLKHSCLNPNGRNFHPRFGRRKTGAKEFNLPIADKGCAQATGKPANVHHLSIANKAAPATTPSCFTSIHAGQMQLQPLLLCPPTCVCHLIRANGCRTRVAC